MRTLGYDRCRWTALLACMWICSASAVGAGQYKDWVSDEQANQPARCDSGFMDGIECAGRYCDRISISCEYTSSIGRTTDFSRPISDGRDNEFKCPAGSLISGLRCTGKYCDNVAFTCTEVPFGTKSCRWLGIKVSDGTGKHDFAAGTYAAGVRCSGKYCDNKDFYTCEPDGVVVKAVRGYWQLVDSCSGRGCKMSETVSIGVSSETSKSKAKEWGQSLTASIEATAGGDAEGGSVTAGFSATMSQSQTTTLSQSLSRSYQTSKEISCEPDDSASVRAMYQYRFRAEQQCSRRGDCDPVTIGSQAIVCASDPPNGAANFEPACMPGCCRNRNCTQCETSRACQRRR